MYYNNNLIKPTVLVNLRNMRPPDKSVYLKITLLFLNQNICCGYSKNHLIKTVLLSTQNTCLNRSVKNNCNFTLKSFVYLDRWNTQTKKGRKNKKQKNNKN